MQDKYAGDIGDYIKLGLLRALQPGRKLGIAWYHYPDEPARNDGKHIAYLDDPGRYQHYDPALYQQLRGVVASGRSIAALHPTLPDAVFSASALDVADIPHNQRRLWRQDWFAQTLKELRECDLVFADPDNGLVDDGDHRKGTKTFAKQIPLAEALRLAEGRTAVIYHHNTRRPGGHDAEVDFWLGQLPPGAMAVRARKFSCRSFFILNPDEVLRHRVEGFCAKWRGCGVSLHD